MSLPKISGKIAAPKMPRIGKPVKLTMTSFMVKPTNYTWPSKVLANFKKK